MTKLQMKKRKEEIYQKSLSFIANDRQQIYMELGIIISIIGDSQEN